MLIQNEFQIYSRNTNSIKDANRFEISNSIPLLDVSFFKSLIQSSPSRFYYTLQFVLDQMQLRNVYELLNLIAQDDNIGFQNQLELITYILGNKKFISLFQGSLEMQKYVFVNNLVDLIEDDETF